MAARNYGRPVPVNTAGTVLWRLFWGWCVLCGGSLGALLLVGGVSSWSDPTSSTAWRVVPIAAGLMFLAMAFAVVMLLMWRPRASIETVMKNSKGHPGMTLIASRRRELSLLVFTAVGVLNTVIGALFAEGLLRVVLATLTGLLLLPLVAIARTYRRP